MALLYWVKGESGIGRKEVVLITVWYPGWNSGAGKGHQWKNW